MDHASTHQRQPLPSSGSRQRSGQGEGDFRGRYGYGRPAYKPDPNASYGFDIYPIPRRH